MAYLYYYDNDDNKIGHDFDIPSSKITTIGKANISFILEIPENYSYSKIVFEANKIEKENHFKTIIISILLIVAYEIVKHW
jgi:hypothetical protein